MMSKFEMALLTVTVVGTLVAWPALQQDSFVRPADDTAGMACGVRSSALHRVRRRPAESAHRPIGKCGWSACLRSRQPCHD